MADVFVSYARQDWAIANALVLELQARGFSVWWDRDIVGGSGFKEKIETELRAARAVIVIWSRDAAKSVWVNGEATQALRDKKLISTRLPEVRYNQIPESFQEQQTDIVSDLDKIVMALAALGAQAGPVGGLSQPKPADRLASALLQHQRSASAQVTFFLPVAVFFVAVLVGAGLVLGANAIGIAWVQWEPTTFTGAAFVKEVGYLTALNWSLAGVIFFPLAWALVMLSVETLFDIRRSLVRYHMVTTTDFEPITFDDTRFSAFFRDVKRMTIILIVLVSSLIIWFSMHDFHSVVGRVYIDDQIAKTINDVGPAARVPIDHHELERDWSIATFLNRADQSAIGREQNWWFALAVHIIYPGLGVGIIFAFFLILMGIGMFFLPRAARSYGLTIIPRLDSSDPRCGFEVFSELFGHAISIMALTFCCCYLMLLQNIYLRVEAPTLSSFVLPDFQEGIAHLYAGQYGEAVDALIGNTFAKHIPYGAIQSVVAWFLGAFMAIAFVGIAYMFLRSSAMRGRKLVLNEIEAHGMSGLIKISDLPQIEVEQRLKEMQAWPLSWPKLNQMLFWYALIFSSLVFYKLGLLFIPLTLIFVVCNTFAAAEES